MRSRTVRKIKLSFKRAHRRLRHWLDDTEIFVSDILYDRRKDIPARLLGYFLIPFSWLFSLIVKIRSYNYQKGIFTSEILGCPVIVVGNLTVGGTGKTPVVEKIARELRERGRKVAILSRGYKSKKEPAWKKWIRFILHKNEPPPRVVSNGKRVLLGAEIAGDEPFMLASNLPGVIVVVDKDRVKAGRYAIKTFGADVLVLDDGFQYRSLRGHINLLLVDKTNPFGNYHLLPRGILREPLSAMKRASYIFLTKADNATHHDILKEIRAYNARAKIVQCAHFPRNIVSIDRKESKHIDFLFQKKIMAFSGIASPDSFEGFLTKNGAEIVIKKRFADHHRFSKQELDNLIQVAQSHHVDFVITTEKDAVRLPADFAPQTPFFFLKIDIEILSGEDNFEEAISKFDTPKNTLS